MCSYRSNRHNVLPTHIWIIVSYYTSTTLTFRITSHKATIHLSLCCWLNFILLRQYNECKTRTSQSVIKTMRADNVIFIFNNPTKGLRCLFENPSSPFYHSAYKSNDFQAITNFWKH